LSSFSSATSTSQKLRTATLPALPALPARYFTTITTYPSEALAGATVRDKLPLIAPAPLPANLALKQIMPRPPKNKAIEPAKVAVAPPRHIDVDNFIRVRDSVSQPVFSYSDLVALHFFFPHDAPLITVYHS
jgi:hypothetical protein